MYLCSLQLWLFQCLILPAILPLLLLYCEKKRCLLVPLEQIRPGPLSTRARLSRSFLFSLCVFISSNRPSPRKKKRKPRENNVRNEFSPCSCPVLVSPFQVLGDQPLYPLQVSVLFSAFYSLLFFAHWIQSSCVLCFLGLYGLNLLCFLKDASTAEAWKHLWRQQQTGERSARRAKGSLFYFAFIHGTRPGCFFCEEGTARDSEQLCA